MARDPRGAGIFSGGAGKVSSFQGALPRVGFRVPAPVEAKKGRAPAVPHPPAAQTATSGPDGPRSEVVMSLVPMVIETTGRSERAYDIYSRLLKDRIVLLGSEVNDAVASLICAQLLFLESQDPEKEIYLYINSPGGSITAGMAIYDTMNYVKCDVSTICIGMAASMGAFLLSSGAKGKRLALPNSEIMIHQPLGGMQGQATDIRIHADRIIKIKEKLNQILAANTGKSVEQIAQDTERDHFLSANESLEYGLIDRVIEKHL